MEIGLYFGSFNPIHMGHLIIASYAKQHTNLRQVWLVVSPQNPLKKIASLLNEYHRLHLVKLAIEDDDRLKASDVEFHLSKPSFTAHTLIFLKEKYPAYSFSIIMGSDSLSNFAKWKNYEYIAKHHKIYVFKRPGFELAPNLLMDIEIINAPLLDISSTKIREMVKTGQPIRYFVPDKVAKEIQENGYYKPPKL